MKKVFIDCGSHNGCSVRTFKRLYADSSEFEIHCFEANPEHFPAYDDSEDWMNSVTLHKQAVWIEDGRKEFFISRSHTSSTLERDKLDVQRPVRPPRKLLIPTKTYDTPVINLGGWIKSTFTKDDHIVLKLDIEGSEYEVIESMSLDGSLHYIDDMFGELHASKMKRYRSSETPEATARTANNTLLKTLEDHGLVMWEWYAYERESPSGKFERYRDLPLKYRKYNIL